MGVVSPMNKMIDLCFTVHNGTHSHVLEFIYKVYFTMSDHVCAYFNSNGN